MGVEPTEINEEVKCLYEYYNACAPLVFFLHRRSVAWHNHVWIYPEFSQNYSG